MSALNCKPGDLAIVVHSDAGNHGKIVECLELVPDFKFKNTNEIIIATPSWRIDRFLRCWDGGQINYIPDSFLRPLPPLSEDESTPAFKDRGVLA